MFLFLHKVETLEDIILLFLLDSDIVGGGVVGNSGGHVEGIVGHVLEAGGCRHVEGIVGHHVEAGGCRHVEGVVGGVVVPLHHGEQEEPPAVGADGRQEPRAKLLHHPGRPGNRLVLGA